jgi:hypothetical protein
VHLTPRCEAAAVSSTAVADVCAATPSTTNLHGLLSQILATPVLPNATRTANSGSLAPKTVAFSTTAGVPQTPREFVDHRESMSTDYVGRHGYTSDVANTPAEMIGRFASPASSPETVSGLVFARRILLRC